MKELYLNLFKSIRTEHLKFDFSTDCLVVDETIKSRGIFLQYTPMHKEGFIKYAENTSFAYTSLPMSQEDFINKYLKFMSEYKNFDRNIRYATTVLIIYPKAVSDIQKQKKFVKAFVENICGIKTEVPFFVENIYKKNCVYAKITVIERSFLGNSAYKIYTADKYIDERTGKWASRTCPEKYKLLKCKKGDFIYVKGKRVETHGAVFSNALRIFVYAKDKFQEFIDRLKQMYTSTVLNVCEKVKSVKNGKRLHKTTNKPTYHRYVKRRIAALNYAKQTIEFTTNYLLQNECEKDIVYHPYNDAKADVIRHSDMYKKIVSVFMKYKERFKKKCFHDEEGLEYRIDYYDMRVDILDQNIDRLITMFFNEITRLLEKDVVCSLVN